MPGWTESGCHTNRQAKGELPALINLEWPADKSRLKMHPLELGVYISGTHLSRAFSPSSSSSGSLQGQALLAPAGLPQVAHLEEAGLGPSADLFRMKSLLKDSTGGEGGAQAAAASLSIPAFHGKCCSSTHRFMDGFSFPRAINDTDVEPQSWRRKEGGNFF